MTFDRALWDEIRSAAQARERPRGALAIHGSDLYGEALKTARANVAAAGFEDVIELARLRMPDMYSLFCSRPDPLISRDMVFGIPALIAFITNIMTLEVGDIIATGTPEGVAQLYPGDLVEVELAGLETVQNPVVAHVEERRW